jgi:hypothetical protein
MRVTAFLPALALSLTAVVSRGTEFKVHGVTLPNGAVRIGSDENRYRLQESLEAALKWYKGLYRPEKYLRKLIVNQPGIKAIHIENPDPKGEWEGFNLYTYQGETRIYILGRERTER